MARRRVPLGSLRSTAPSKPPSDWRTRIGCKRSAPNASPLKKKKPYREVAADSNVSNSHQGNWSLSGQCGTGQALRCDSSEHNFSPKREGVNCQNSCSTEYHPSGRGASHLHDMHPLHDTADHNFSPKGEDMNCQDSCSTAHHHSSRGASYLHDMLLLHDTSEGNYLAVEGDFHLPDSPLNCMTGEELNESKEEVKVAMNLDLQESNKGVTAGNNDISMSDNGNLSMFGHCGSSENFSPKGDDLCIQNSGSTEYHFAVRGASHLHMHRQHEAPEHETPESNCSAIGGDLHLPDSRPKYMTAEELNEDEEASDAESQVDRWACRICKVAAVSIVVLPCSHLCLCWDCEERTEDCPVCGQAKRDVFYINCYT